MGITQGKSKLELLLESCQIQYDHFIIRCTACKVCEISRLKVNVGIVFMGFKKESEVKEVVHFDIA